MILLCGIPTESPLAMVRAELDQLGAPVVMFNQRQFAQMHLAYAVAGGAVTGELRVDGRTYRLEDFDGLYTRLMDDRLLPELRDEPEGSPLRGHGRSLHQALTNWLEVAPCRVVNRSRPNGSNMSKPYQAQLILEHGFRTPETLVTNQPELVREFLERHGRLIYKSISGMRSIVQTLTESDLARLDAVRWCPVQFQAYVTGTDVRVHVVDQAVFPTAIRSNVTDYRYARQADAGEVELEAITLSDDVAGRCVALSRSLGLPFSGIDLKITPAGEVYCLEVNPSPGFSYYEANTGQPIARAVARYLIG